MAPLEIELLGAAAVRSRGAEIALPTRKGLLLLAYLALGQGRPCPRGKLAGLLWDDRAEAQARASLRQELYTLRRAMAGAGDPPLRMTSDAVTLDPAVASVDVHLFEALAARGNGEALEQAATLYRGDLLDGLSVRGAAIEDWLASERSRLRDLATGVLERLLAHDVAQARFGRVAELGRRLVALDPLREQSHRALMTAYLRAGRRSDALRQYQACRRLLEQELGVAPDDQTEQLHARGLAAIASREAPAECPVPIAALASDPAGSDPQGPRASAAAERRQLTVLALELVLSPGLADPEERRPVSRELQQGCARIVARYGGRLTGFLGDTALAYFGWPGAGEDDAERAVRCGLTLVDPLRAAADRQTGAGLRIGIATGLVVAEPAHEPVDPFMIGEPLTTAAALRASCDPGTVMISAATYPLVAGLFEVVPCGTAGAALRVVAVIATGTRFDARHSSPMTSLIGREPERALLRDRWQRAVDGEGQAVLLSGEAGLGKSRLVRDLRDHLVGVSHTAFVCQGAPHHRSSALHPIITHLHHAADLQPGEEGPSSRARLDAWVTDLGASAAELGPPLASMLALAPENDLAGTTPQRLLGRTMEALLRLVEAASRRRPVLIVIEDAHWIDPTSLELVRRIVGQAHDWRVLVIVTSRPGELPDWLASGHVAALTLSRLSRRQGAELVQGLVGPLDAAQMEGVLARAEGVPLFLEELAKSLAEQASAGSGQAGGSPAQALVIPGSLAELLQARLDRLGSAREVAQIAAAIGRDFTLDMLADLADGSGHDVAEAMERLVSAGLVHQRGVSPVASYSFRHVLLRDAAYASLLRSQLRPLHARIAGYLEGRGDGARADLLTHHWAAAGEWELAARYARDAGRAALARAAMTEAATHLRAGLDWLSKLDASAGRQALQIDMLLALGEAFAAAHGTGATATGDAYGRAMELCERSGDLAHLMPALYGRTRYHFSRAELVPALELADRALAIARARGDRPARAVALYVAGWVDLAMGRCASADRHLEHAQALLQSDTRRAVRDACGIDLGVLAGVYRSWCAQMLERPERAAEWCAQAIEAAEASGHALTIVVTLDRAMTLAGLLGDRILMQQRARRMRGLGRAYGFRAYVWKADICLAAGIVERGRAPAGIRLMRRALHALRVNGDEEFEAYSTSLLAAALAQAGRMEEARAAIDEALSDIARSGARLFEGELRHARTLLRGEQGAELFRSGDVDADAPAYRWEIRAAAPPARLPVPANSPTSTTQPRIGTGSVRPGRAGR